MVESLQCNSCGAPLDVPTNIQFVKCGHCGAALNIHRNPSATFTEVAERLQRSTGDLERQVERLSRQTRLQDLERQWEIERSGYMVRDRKGYPHVPNAQQAMGTVVPAVIFGIIWTIMATSMAASMPNFGPFAVAKFVFPLFGICFIGFGIANAVAISRRARSYRSAQQKFQRMRREIENSEEP